MYSKTPHLGKTGMTGFGESAPRTRPKREPYKQREKKVYTNPHNGGTAYIETHSGEYDAREVAIMSDPYADGWKWYKARKVFEKYPVSRFITAAKRAEILRLFTLGYKHAKEDAEQNEQNKTKTVRR